MRLFRRPIIADPNRAVVYSPAAIALQITSGLQNPQFTVQLDLLMERMEQEMPLVGGGEPMKSSAEGGFSHLDKVAATC